TIVDTPHDAVDLGGTSVAAGKPATAILKPYCLPADAALRTKQILDLEGNARPFIARLTAHNCVVAAGEIVGIEHLRKRTPATELGDLAAQYVRGIGTPRNRIGLDDPVIGGLAG